MFGATLTRQAQYDSVNLFPSTTDAVAHSFTQAAWTYIPRPANGLILELDVTAAAAAAGDTLDVTVQTLIDQTNAVDVQRFTLVLGNGGTKRFYAKINATSTLAEFENATALAAATSRPILGDAYRLKYTIVDGGAHGQSFTFAVWLRGM